MDFRQILLLTALLFLTVLWIKVRLTPKAKQARLRGKVRKGGFTYWEKFESEWIVSEKDRVGLKYNDFSGCYVILIFEKPVHGRRFSGWENIYVGQSVNVCQRVHNHFNGKGKGDVYADIKYGKFAYVRIIPVKQKRLNDMETALIEAFSATESYNKTKGGAKQVK